MKNSDQHADNKPRSDKEVKAVTIVEGSGNLTFEGSVIISGKFHGKLIVRGSLEIGKNAVVQGEIITDFLYLSGSYSGNAFVEKKSTFYSGSIFSGFLVSNNAIFEEGCLFKGGRSAPLRSVSDEPKPDRGEKIKEEDDDKAFLKSLLNN